VAELIRRYLAREGLRVQWARTAAETEVALAALAGTAVVVLDLTMPGLDARAIRKLVRGGAPSSRRGRPRLAVTGAGPGVPLICLTGGEGTQAAPGLRPPHIGVGQESCLTRPFGPRALVARVRAAARPGLPATPHAAGRLRLRPGQRLVTLDGTEIALTGTEFDVLSCLARQAGRAVTRHRLRQAAWGRSAGPGDRTVDVYIAQLRAKLGPDHGIRTVRGVGYVLDPQTETGGPAGSPDVLHPGGQASRRSAPATIVGAGHPTGGDSETA
jgi:DNA-binding response OmpR family regulator